VELVPEVHDATILQAGAPVTGAGFEYAPAVIVPAPAHSLAALPTLPFAAQLRLIERELDDGSPPDALLRALASLRDHEPLAHAVVRAAQAGLLTSVADAVAAVFATLPDTGVQRVLRATIAAEQRAIMPAEQRAVIVAAVRAAMETLPLARCAALCLMDRWLKNASPETRAAVVARAVAALEAALAPSGRDAQGGPGAQDALGALPDEVLMRVPGQELARLAAAQPAGIRARLEARLSAFADRVLDVLGAAPKSLSQANAEELLSRRVYTDPGHFLVELLQNAEDAGARAWRVDIGDHDVAVWHDGTPFDAKDMVGVLSIGQTTKHKEQIGFFGVGFKSVYEICERPQVYSGPFCFEIADVSIPRRLAGRPEGRPGDGTLLVLALRDPGDPERNPDRLYERALDVPPETLLTLRNIRELAASRGARSRTVRAERGGLDVSDIETTTSLHAAPDTGSQRPYRVDLVHVESGARTGYVTVRDRFAYDGGGREGSRASATDVLVALRLDERDLPVPLPAGAATIYSFLPTRERSGLRFLVHAHFDLPVDRERLDLDSRYNRWVLARAGSLLARAAHEVVAGDASDRIDRARALLDVLPRPDELSHPAYVALANQARDALAAVPCLPGAEGALVAPRQAALAEDAALEPVLAGVDLDGQGQRLLGALSPSAARTAAYLGARRFDTTALVALVARTPEVLDRGEAILLDALGRATEHAEIGRLSEVAFARDHQGRRTRPGALARADEALRAIYGRVRPLLAADLDLGASPEKERLWRRLDVPVLDARTLIADLGDEGRAGALLHGQGARAVVAYLVARPAHLAAFVEALASGAIAMDAQRARALHAALDAVADDLSPRLGVRLGRAALFPDRQGALRPLAGPDAALVPADAEDTELIALAPDAPWLDAEIAALPYIARLLGHLDVHPTGAATVTSALLLEDDRLLDATDDEAARRAYAYLIAHADDVPATLRRRLAAAPAWFSAEGARLPLAALRRPPRDATLAALYEAWRAVSLIDERGPASALALATALGLDAQVAATDHDALVDDLHRGPNAGLDIASVRGLVCAALRDAARVLPRGRLVRAARAPLFRVERAGLPGDELWPLVGWNEPLEAGCGRALGSLRLALAHGSRPLLAAADEDDWAVFLAALAGDPAAAPATVIDLVSVLERDPAMQAPAARDAGRRALAALRPEVTAQLGTEAGRARLRALPIWPVVATGPSRHGDYRPAHAVVRGRDLGALLAVDTGERAIEGAIEASPERATDVWQRAFASGEHGLLDEAAAGAEADALADLCSFADPRRALRAAIAAVARPGEPVAAQHPLLATPARVAHLARVVARDAGAEVVRGLPLSVDAAGRLVAGVRHHAGERERAITAGLPVHDQLGDPVWAALVGDELAPRLSLRQILSAVADDTRVDVAVNAHPRLADPARRAAVYQWLLERSQDILADEQARGLLGRAAVIATTGGFLRPVRALLLDRALPDLGIDWNAADEVPAALVAWLRRHFAPDEHQLVRLVGHLLDACDAAAAAGDGARSAELLGHLARSLRVGEVEPREVEAAVQRFKLRKRLRVETDAGDFARPRTLLAPPPGDWPLITAFAAGPPARVSARYTDEAARALITAAGASERLDEETLRALMAGTGRASGVAAGIALARYLARWASREPALRDSLHLRSAAWVPDGTGALRPARALYWPDSDAPLVVGEDPRRYPHPELAHTAPADLTAWLPFCRLDEAALEDVVAHIDGLLAQGREPGAEVPAWLERGLERGRLRPAEVRSALATRRFLRDDDGVLRTADEVVREGAHELFGARRGTWSAGDDYTRLAGALKIARRPGKREVLGYLEEIVAAVDARSRASAPGDSGAGPEVGQGAMSEAAAAVLAEEPGLLATLPRCLAVLAEAGGALPARLALACETTTGTAVLCIAPDPRLALPRPPAAVEAAMVAAAPYLFPLLPEGDGEAVLALLAGLGIPDLAGDSDRAAGARDVDARAERTAAQRQERHRGQTRRQPRPADERAARRPEDHDDERASESGRPSGDHERDQDVTATEPLPEQSPTSRGWLGRLRGWLSPRDQDGPSESKPDSKEGRDAEREAERQEHRKPGSEDRREDRRENAREAGSERPRPGATSKPGRAAARLPRAGAAGAGDDSDDASESTLPAAPDQRAWFRPRQRIGAQMHDHSAWIADRTRAATYGLAFEPRALPAPYLYGPQTIAGRFQAAGQRWLEIPLDPSWRQAGSSGAHAQAGAAGAHTMTLRGRVPVGEVVLPVPLFGHVTSVRARPDARLLETRDGTPLLVALDDCEVEYTVILPPAPRYEDAAVPSSAPAALLAPTADDRELPDEALRLADELASSALPPLQRALAVRDFVRTRYYYDPAYLESPEVARWLDRLSRGRSNAHLAALHAGRDDRHLGRGVCYELNAMACELLRRAGMPAAVATGWTFDRGYVDEPDHMWAMTLLDTADGLRWLPIDASTTREGRPLHVGRRPPGPWRAPADRGRTAPPPPPAWDRERDVRRYEPEPVPLGDLVRVVRYLEQVTGQQLGNASQVRELCRQILQDVGAGRGLLDLVRALAGREPD
jgi:transglutaminase-like putative cysteine protease